MEKQILELLTKLNDNIVKGFSDINDRIDKVESSIQSLETAMREGFHGRKTI